MVIFSYTKICQEFYLLSPSSGNIKETYYGLYNLFFIFRANSQGGEIVIPVIRGLQIILSSACNLVGLKPLEVITFTESLYELVGCAKNLWFSCLHS